MKHQCPPAHAAADNPVCATPVVSFGLSENLEYVVHMERQHVKSGIGGVGWPSDQLGYRPAYRLLACV